MKYRVKGTQTIWLLLDSLRLHASIPLIGELLAPLLTHLWLHRLDERESAQLVQISQCGQGADVVDGRRSSRVVDRPVQGSDECPWRNLRTRYCAFRHPAFVGEYKGAVLKAWKVENAKLDGFMQGYVTHTYQTPVDSDTRGS